MSYPHLYVLLYLQDPLPLEKCIIYCEPEWDDFFEIHEFVSKESFVFKVRAKSKYRVLYLTTFCVGVLIYRVLCSIGQE